MNIEQAIRNIVIDAFNNTPSALIGNRIIQALLSSPDIVVVERKDLEKMQRMVKAAKNIKAIGFIKCVEDFEKALALMEVE